MQAARLESVSALAVQCSKLQRAGITAVLIMMVLVGCGQGEAPMAEIAPSGPIAVQTEKLEPLSLRRAFSTYGSIIPAEEFEISADVAALVKQVNFDEGQSVEAGDVLLVLDDAKYRLQLKTATAQLSSARAALDEARANHSKNASVYERGAISQQQFQQSLSRLQSAQASVDAARAEKQLAQQDLDNTRIVSPVSGKVTQRRIEPGKSISPQLSVGRISSSDAFWVETYVSQKDINYLSKGMDCNVSISGVAEGAAVLPGKVDIIASSANQATGNYRVRVALSDPLNRLRDGMMARVNFDEIYVNDVLSLPRTAVVDHHRHFVVFKYSDGRAEQIEPALAVGNEERYIVLDGLVAGDELIVTEVSALIDGSEVVKQAVPG